MEDIITIKRKTTPFTESGECKDEIEFVFDDGKRLYVSENFLNYVSQVFKAMFEHNFKEKENKRVTMTGKKYEDVLEFLLCLHPNVQKSVTKDNVLSVVHIAEEYQAELMITRCKSVMSAWLKSELASAQISKSSENRVECVRTCLTVLSESASLQYNALIQEACKVIAHFGHDKFTGTKQWEEEDNEYSESDTDETVETDDDSPINDCKKLFDNLSTELKYNLVRERLKFCDNLQMHGENTVKINTSAMIRAVPNVFR